MKKSILTVILFIFSSTSLLAQNRILSISSALDQFGRNKSQMATFLKNRGFKFKSTSGSMASYVLSTENGDYNLTVAYRKLKVSAIAWNEHLTYIQYIMREIVEADFLVKKSYGSGMSFVSSSHDKVAGIIPRPNNRDVFISIALSN